MQQTKAEFLFHAITQDPDLWTNVKDAIHLIISNQQTRTHLFPKLQMIIAKCPVPEHLRAQKTLYSLVANYLVSAAVDRGIINAEHGKTLTAYISTSAMKNLIHRGVAPTEPPTLHDAVNTTTPSQPSQPKEPPTMRFETRHFIDNEDAATLDDNNIFECIRDAEKRIEHLSAIVNKPKKLEQQIEKLRQYVADVVAYVDAR